ncbi:pilus assembly PilX family protein [Marinospirillum minutulum]|uniref:pilus assembly PilX family protein n=1 Tax=Marinospirillum minutulum TaxID=64974 RepID=UPI0003FBB4B7|nr:hypothetical protein [Marinospirillum minutulum]
MKTQPKKRNTQQGYILVVALIAMLFVGAVFVASSNRSGAEERLATSQVHAASLESAIYAGMYRVETTSNSNNADGDSAASVCEAIKSELSDELLAIKKTFQTATDNNPAIYWKLVKLGSCKDYTGDDPKVEKEFQFNLIAWQGDESKPISRIAGNGKILIKNNNPEPNGVIDGLNNVFNQHGFGNNAAVTSGTLSLTGGAEVKGNVAASGIVIKGGAEITDGNLAYEEIDMPNNMKDKNWYKKAEKMLLDEKIKVDPLGLEKAMNESFYTDQDDKEILLNNLPKASVRDAFANLEHGQKKEMGQFPFQRARITPEKFEVYNADWRVEDHQEVDIPIYSPVSLLGEDVSLRVFDDFKINSGGKDPSLTISGGRVILFIDGDVEMNGGASMQIDSDSSLTLIVTGEFKLTGGFEFLNKNAVNDKGEPLFTLLSTYAGKKEAVKISGGTKLYGVVYALSDLKLGGSGTIVGQAFAANINANGGTAIDYQPAFGDGGTDAFTPELDSDFEINY